MISQHWAFCLPAVTWKEVGERTGAVPEAYCAPGLTASPISWGPSEASGCLSTHRWRGEGRDFRSE